MAPSGIPGYLQLYLALPSIGALLGGPHISPLSWIENESKLESKERSAIGDSSKDSTEGSS